MPRHRPPALSVAPVGRPCHSDGPGVGPVLKPGLGMLRSVVSALARGGGSTCRSFAAVRSCPPTSPSSSGASTGLSSLRGPTELSRDLASLHSSLIRAPPTIGHPPRPSVAPVSFCGLLSCWWSDPNITVAKPESTCVTEGLVAAWRRAPPATVEVVEGDSNPPPTPFLPLVHIY